MDEILERFIQQAPVAVLVRGTLCRVLANSTLDLLFDRVAQAQYTRELTFSALVQLMVKVTFGTFDTVHAAFRHSNMAVSIAAVYDKLQRLETGVSKALVEETATAMDELLRALPWKASDAIAGLRLRTLDGNSLAGTNHRLECLRGCGAAALPGRSLVVREGRTGLLTNLIPCEDAYTSERTFYPEVLPLVQPDDLWMADRNFCTLDYLGGIDERKAFFLVRHHAGTKLEPMSEAQRVGSNATGSIWEQQVRVGWLPMRCLIVRLKEPLRDGTIEMRLLTNVPASKANATCLAELYRKRWHIETAFQELTVSLCCEINTLGYPKAALFAFALACVAYNALRVVQAALQSGQGQKKVEEELSSYHLAVEMATVSEGLAIAVPAASWQRFIAMTSQEFVGWMHQIAKGLNFQRYRKNKRAPKKPTKVRRTQRGAHRSTARVLAEYAQSP